MAFCCNTPVRLQSRRTLESKQGKEVSVSVGSDLIPTLKDQTILGTRIPNTTTSDEQEWKFAPPDEKTR